MVILSRVTSVHPEMEKPCTGVFLMLSPVMEDEVMELYGYWGDLEHALGKLSRLTSVKVTGLQMGGLERMSTFTETLPSRYHNCIRSKLRSIDQRGILTFGTSYEGLR